MAFSPENYERYQESYFKPYGAACFASGDDGGRRDRAARSSTRLHRRDRPGIAGQRHVDAPQDGWFKVAQGRTSIEEIRRVVA
jgi:hypothetical protein